MPGSSAKSDARTSGRPGTSSTQLVLGLDRFVVRLRQFEVAGWLVPEAVALVPGDAEQVVDDSRGGSKLIKEEIPIATKQHDQWRRPMVLTTDDDPVRRVWMVEHNNATPLQLRSGDRDRPSSSVDQLDLVPGERSNRTGRLGRRLSDPLLDTVDLDLRVTRLLRGPMLHLHRECSGTDNDRAVADLP